MVAIQKRSGDNSNSLVDLDMEDNCALIPYSHMTMWSGVDLLLNGVFVSSCGTNWPYAAYVKKLLSTSKAVKDEQLCQTVNYDLDTTADANFTQSVNVGRQTRRDRTTTSRLLVLAYIQFYVKIRICMTHTHTS